MVLYIFENIDTYIPSLHHRLTTSSGNFLLEKSSITFRPTGDPAIDMPHDRLWTKNLTLSSRTCPRYTNKAYQNVKLEGIILNTMCSCSAAHPHGIVVVGLVCLNDPWSYPVEPLTPNRSKMRRQTKRDTGITPRADGGGSLPGRVCSSHVPVQANQRRRNSGRGPL